MMLTAYEAHSLTKDVRTSGCYKLGPDECRSLSCKCKESRGDWVSGCLVCHRRIKP